MSNVKDVFTEQAIIELGGKIKNIQENFQTDKFVSAVFNDEWERLELFARTTHIAKILGGLQAKAQGMLFHGVRDCK